MSTSLRSLLWARIDKNIPDIVGRTAPIALNEDVNTLIFGSICTLAFDI